LSLTIRRYLIVNKLRMIAMKRTIYLLIFLAVSAKSFGQKIGTITDARDGQAYRTITYTIDGKQVSWMVSNLNYEIAGVSVCPNFTDELCKSYGRIYHVSALDKACPSGWHVSSLNEWESIINFFEIKNLTKDPKDLRQSYLAESLLVGGASGLNIKHVGVMEGWRHRDRPEEIIFDSGSTLSPMKPEENYVQKWIIEVPRATYLTNDNTGVRFANDWLFKVVHFADDKVYLDSKNRDYRVGSIRCVKD
jgi:uncharacterized protein (TIGR02145 family)